MDGARRLSVGQEAMWFLYRLAPESRAYNLVMPVRIRGPLHVPVIARAVEAVVMRHDLLRSVFVEMDGHPVRLVREPGTVRLDVREVPGTDDGRLRALVREACAAPFLLADEGPFRAVLLRRSPEDAALVLVAHHIASDATSLGLLLRDLLDAYHGLEAAGRPAWSDLPGDYDDYVEGERLLLGSPRRGRLEGYWRDACAGAAAAELPADLPRPRVSTFNGATSELRIPDELGHRLRQAAAEVRVTPFAFLLSVFQSLLYRHTGQDDSVIGCPSTTRLNPAMRGVVGYFVNPLPLRSRFGASVTFRDVALSTGRQVMRGLANAAYPSVLLPAVLGLPRDAGRSPIYQIAVSMVAMDRLKVPLPEAVEGESEGSEVEYQGLRLALIDVPQQEGQLDLMVELQQNATRWRAVLTYNTDLFERASIERFASHFGRLVEAAVGNPDGRVADASLMDQTELERLLALGTGAVSSAR